MTTPCAACGAPEAFDQFIVDRPECRGVFKLCSGCWSEGREHEAWNEAITQRIIARRGTPAQKTTKPAARPVRRAGQRIKGSAT